MKKLVCAAAIISLLFASVSSFALPVDEMDGKDEVGVFTGEKTKGIPLDELNEKTEKLPRDEKNGMDKMKELFEKGKKAQETDKFLELGKKGKILLKAEPKDGVVSLSWILKGVHLKPGDKPLKFTVFYGTESGSYGKKIDVGTTRDFVLRGLINQRTYYIKVQGTTQLKPEGEEETKALDLVLFSDEVKATPLPAEELGSALEKAFAKKVATLQDSVETDSFERELKQFGYDFFRNSAPSGVLADNIPVGGDYVIGPGDSLRVDIWGSIQARYEATVDRNGEVTLPKVGAVKVWGLSYSQAKEVINKAISRFYKGYDFNLTMGKLRSIQVYVVGEVESPGTYSVTSLATVINALSQAGGPSKNGSLRAIKLLRGAKTVGEIDLYDMLLGGDRSKDVRLENGDTVLVPVIGSVAAVAGEVKRPGIYELKGKESLAQVLKLAGNITAAGDTGRIQVERFEGNQARIVIDYEPKAGQIEEDLDKVAVMDRDMIKVFPVFKALRHVVSVKGNVVRPGEYQYREGMKVTDVIPSFGALLPDTYLDSAEIIRVVAPDFHKEALTFNLRKALEGDAKENLPLQEQDAIRIFPRSDMEEKPVVHINGQVLNPGVYDFFQRMTVRDLVTVAGNLKRNAFPDNAELTRLVVENGKAVSSRKNINLKRALAGDPEHNVRLQPDDVLIVRGVVEWIDTGERLVTLKGEFKFPGTYSIAKGEKLDSVILRAGGFTSKAYLKGAKFTRKSVQESQQKRMDEIVLRSEQDILRKQGELASLAASKEELEATKASLEGLMKNLEKLKQTKAEGRIVVHLTELGDLRDSSYNVEMMGGDVLEVPRTSNVVNVMGEVYNPTTFVHTAGSSVGTYLKSAGGPTRNAEEDEIYIIKADGSVESRQQSSFGIHWDESAKRWTFGSFMSKPLDSGDTLVVPQKLERTAWLRDIKDITTILSQVALTAGTVLIGLR